MKTTKARLATALRLAALAAALTLPACTSATEETEGPSGVELAPSGVSQSNYNNNPINYPRQVTGLGVRCTEANEGQQWAENFGYGRNGGYYVIQCGSIGPDGGWWNVIEACWDNQEPSCQQY